MQFDRSGAFCSRKRNSKLIKLKCVKLVDFYRNRLRVVLQAKCFNKVLVTGCGLGMKQYTKVSI